MTTYIPRAEQYLFSLFGNNAKKYVGMLQLNVPGNSRISGNTGNAGSANTLSYVNFVYKNLMSSDSEKLTLNGIPVDPTKLSGYIVEMLTDLITYSITNLEVYGKCHADETRILDNVHHIQVYARSIIYGDCKCDFCKDAQVVNKFSIKVGGHMRIKHLYQIYKKLSAYQFYAHNGRQAQLYSLKSGKDIMWFDAVATYENKILVIRINCTNCDSYLIYQPYHIKLP